MEFEAGLWARQAIKFKVEHETGQPITEDGNAIKQANPLVDIGSLFRIKCNADLMELMHFSCLKKVHYFQALKKNKKNSKHEILISPAVMETMETAKWIKSEIHK